MEQNNRNAQTQHIQACNNGISCKEVADEHHIGVASVERYYHQMMQHKSSHWANRTCPRILGIDERRYARFFLQSLQGRHKVKVACIDMNSAYRRQVRELLPNARIVADRFHVIRLVNQHFL